MDAIIVKDYGGANEVGKVALAPDGSVKVEGQLQLQLQDIVDRIMSQQPLRTADAVLKHGIEWGAERDFVPGQDPLLLAICQKPPVRAGGMLLTTHYARWFLSTI